MPSPPTPFDDEADRASGTSAGTSASLGTASGFDTSSRPDPPSHRNDGRPSPVPDRHPNFWVRRIVVIGGVVAVFLAAAAVVNSLIDTTAGDTTSGAIDADWNRIVLVDERTGRVTVENDAGEETGRIDTGTRSILDAALVDTSALVVSATETSIVDLDAQSSTEVAIEADAVSWPSGSALTMIAAARSGARGILVHGPTGDVIDTDDVAPIAGTRYEWAGSRAVPSGRDLLVTDSGNFQSVLLSFDRDEPSYFPGLALAIDGDVVVTAQNIGANAAVEVFDHDGESVASGSTSSVRAALIGDGTIQLVTVDGEIVSMSMSSGETDSIGQLEIGAVESGVVSSSGDRLIVSGTDGSAIVDTDGSVVGAFPQQQPLPGGTATAGSTCVILSDGSAPDGGGRVTVVTLADGSIVNEVDVTVPLWSTADGCTVASTIADGYLVASPEAVTTVTTDGELAGFSPDGASVVLSVASRLSLTDATIGDDDAGVDLGPAGRRIGFTQL
jgi:hypothetical protein